MRAAILLMMLAGCSTVGGPPILEGPEADWYDCAQEVPHARQWDSSAYEKSGGRWGSDIRECLKQKTLERAKVRNGAQTT